LQQENAPVYGSLPIPWYQTTLAGIVQSAGYETVLVTDTYHQFELPMDFHRGFKVYRWIRGQERDHYKPPSSVSEEEMRRRYYVHGEGLRLASTSPTYRAAGRPKRTGSLPKCLSTRWNYWREPAGESPSLW
jgi:hypothetical protein